MTKDFRNVGRITPPNAADSPAATARTTAPPTLQQRKIIVLSIRLAAVLFFLAGLWLVNGGSGPFPADTAKLIGVAFIISAIIDLAAIKFMQILWTRQANTNQTQMPPR